MTLAFGTRLGAYEITGTLGAGGMGEVYRARDTRLQRDVALKFLPDAFATDPERLARFRREAQLLAALNHQHIATIHGLEETNGSQFLVMELVEGETLADRIARSGGPEGPPLRTPGDRTWADRRGGPSGPPLPLEEALAIARQVADALHAAHEKGIIHRDLKPSNIAFTAAGDVKVLDFGLAKMLAPEGTGAADVAATHSPTLSLAATQAGVILGTASYMAPEQAKGRAVDKRADMWAFGCVLYEMLAGRRAFDGEDVTDIIGAVVRLEPDWSALPGDCPSPVRTLLRRCLEKDPRKRIADISTALFVLDEIHDHVGRVLSDPPERRIPKDPAYTRSGRRRIAYVAAAALVLGGVMTGGAVWLWTRPAPPRVTRLTIMPSEEAVLTIGGATRDLAMTPDGSRVIYRGNDALWLRRLDALEPAQLVAVNPTFRSGGIFISPDGQWVGYVEGATLKKVAITGGPAVTLLRLDNFSRGATWASDNTIIFATLGAATGLHRVSAGGGDATVLTRPDAKSGEADHVWPEMLPGGRHVLFTITAASGGLDSAQIAVLDLETGTYRIVLRGGTHAHYVPSGHLVYAAAGTLRAVAFGLDRLEARGTPVPILPRLVTTEAGAADFSAAVDGTLVYVDAPGFGPNDRTLVWVDRKGVQKAVGTPPRAYGAPRLSADGTRVALVVGGADDSDLWIWDLDRSTLTRLTAESGSDNYPVWTPDGRRIVYANDGNLYIRAADGTGTAERLTESDRTQFPTAISPDGTRVVFYEYMLPKVLRDLRLLTLAPGPRLSVQTGRQASPNGGSGEPVTLLETPFNERFGILSPNGRWLAYEADPSGMYEIYVRPFPNVGDGQWQVSTGGGRHPAWNRNGRELFYVAPDDALFAVPVETQGTSWKAGRPTRLFAAGNLFFGNLARMYDVSPDGQQFLMLAEVTDRQAVSPQIVVVQNWLEELKRLVPVD